MMIRRWWRKSVALVRREQPEVEHDHVWERGEWFWWPSIDKLPEFHAECPCGRNVYLTFFEGGRCHVAAHRRRYEYAAAMTGAPVRVLA